jgi:hypothetical protein
LFDRPREHDPGAEHHRHVTADYALEYVSHRQVGKKDVVPCAGIADQDGFRSRQQVPVGQHDAFGASRRPRGVDDRGERVGRDMRFGFRTGVRSRREPSAGIAQALALLAQILPSTQTHHALEIGHGGAVRGKTQPPVIRTDAKISDAVCWNE